MGIGSRVSEGTELFSLSPTGYPAQSSMPVASDGRFGAAAERIDVCAGVLIGFRGVAETLREEISNTRARNLVWKGERETLFGKTRHQVDWNPALERLSKAIDDVDGWISAAFELAASAHAVPRNEQESALEAALVRSGESLRMVATYLAGIRAAQYALHEAPSYVVGGLGFNDGIIERLNVLHARLEALRDAPVPARLQPEISLAVDATTSYVDAYFRGLRDGAKLLETAHVVSMVTGAIGMTRALAATARLLAGATVESGGLTLALAGAGGGASVAAAEASIQGIVKGIIVVTAAGTFQMAGGVGPVNAGKEGERLAGITGPKVRIPSLNGTAKFRIPDKVTELTVEEVKNVVKLSRTRQLLDYLEFCHRTGRTLIIRIPSMDIKISKGVMDLYRRGLLRLETFP